MVGVVPPARAERGDSRPLMAAAGGPGPTCVLGIDLGTTSVKAALVTGTERGLALAQSCSRETQAHSDSLGEAPQVRAARECSGKSQDTGLALQWLGCLVHWTEESSGFPEFCA